MIVKDAVPSLDKLRPYFQAPMLMLGKQRNPAGYVFPCAYQTLDPDGGDIAVDLSADIHTAYAGDVEVRGPYLERFQTVFDLGTLEHIWDVHAAYVNAASMVRIGGHFIGQAPISGWEGHGIHLTSPWAIMDFFTLNGFALVQMWQTTANGAAWETPLTRNMGKSILMWYVARRVMLVERWKAPQQVYEKGVKPQT